MPQWIVEFSFWHVSRPIETFLLQIQLQLHINWSFFLFIQWISDNDPKLWYNQITLTGVMSTLILVVYMLPLLLVNHLDMCKQPGFEFKFRTLSIKGDFQFFVTFGLSVPPTGQWMEQHLQSRGSFTTKKITIRRSPCYYFNLHRYTLKLTKTQKIHCIMILLLPVAVLSLLQDRKKKDKWYQMNCCRRLWFWGPLLKQPGTACPC